MKIKVKRTVLLPTHSIGDLFIDDVFFCNTMEDTDRGLTSDMTLREITDVKVKHETAIPKGTYKVTLSVQSPRFSKVKFYKDNVDGYLPRLIDVPGFDGVLIHVGNYAKDSSGCILVGLKDKANTMVSNSRDTFIKLYKVLNEASKNNEEINITIE